MAGKFPQAWLDELNARTDIVQIASAYLPLKKNGRRYTGLCPFHHEKSPSFSVSQDLNLYYCFGCKAGGNVIQFVMEMEHMTFYEAVQYLAEKARMTMPEVKDDPEYENRKSQRERLWAANREAARFYHAMLWTDEGKPMLDYLHGRGLDDGIITRFGLGASSPEWDKLTRHLEGKGYTRDELKLAGLTVIGEKGAHDMFHNRVIFPIIDGQGNVLGFGGRTMGQDKPKYLNTPDTPVFNKRKGVYAANLLRKLRDLKHVTLVEGYMDVVSLTQAGIPGVVATLGTALTEEQARLLKRYAPEVYVSYDGDEPGQNAIEKALGIFEAEEVPAKVLYFPGGRDPDEFIRESGIDAYNKLVPMTPIAFKMQRLRLRHDMETQEGRTEYAKACADVLQKVKDPVEMANYLETLAVQTGFAKDVLLAQIGVSAQAMGQKAEKPRSSRHIPRLGEEEKGESYRIEQKLLALYASGKLPGDVIRVDDFSDEKLHGIAQALLAGQKPADIISSAEDDAYRAVVSETFSLLDELEFDNAEEVAGDCLRKLRQFQLENEINELKQKMTMAENAEQRSTLLGEIVKLTKELNAVKQGIMQRK